MNNTLLIMLGVLVALYLLNEDFKDWIENLF